ncbi:helix-turn-helix domain-containing protein [Rhodococcus zopfii]|uniref:helix-turn-helix domain-containing protein n=1 Tax=Rhodococcus zopfii TaxID=43772 RepID=UPI000B12BFD4|nr:helix-turn-helix transcriptional regulator [Rhodococcus zopfii]
MNAQTDDLAGRLGEIVDRARRAAGISQQDFARMSEMSHRTLQRSLAGERSFTFEELINMARVLDVPPESLYAIAG